MDKIKIGSFDFDTNEVSRKIDELTRKSQQLSAEIQNQQTVINQTIQKYRQLSTSMNLLVQSGQRNTTVFRGLRSELVQTSGTLNTLQSDFVTMSQQQSNYQADIQRLETIQQDLQRSTELLSAEYSAQERNLNQLQQEHQQMIQLLERERAINGELANSTQQLTNNIRQNENAQQQLETSTRNVTEAQTNATTSSIDFSGALSEFGSGNIRAGIDGITTSVRALGTQLLALLANPIGAIVAIVGATAMATKALYDYNSGLSETATLVKQFTTLTDSEAIENMAVKAGSFAQQTGEDVKEVLRTVNSVAQAFGLSYDEAFEKVKAGYIQVGASAEDFFDNTSEYSAQFKNAGYSADEFFAIMKAGTQNGIYKDKMVDSIKEVDLRLKDLSKNGREALESAFGKSFTDTLVKGIENGSITTKKALEMISEETKKAGVSAGDMQKISANVFGAMGEDAGGFTKILESIDDGLENNKKGLTETEQLTMDAMKAQEDFQQALADALFVGDDGFKKFTLTIKKEFFNAMLIGIKKVVEFTNSMIDMYNNSMLVRAIFAGIGATFKNQYEVIKIVLKSLVNQFSSLGTIINGIFTLDGAKVASGVTSFYKEFGKAIKAGASNIKDNFNDAVNSTLNGKIEHIKDSSTVGGDTTSTEDQKGKPKDKPEDTPKANKDKKVKEKKEKVEKAEDTLANALSEQEKYASEMAKAKASLAQQEIANEIQKNQQILDENKRLNDDLVNQEIERLTKIGNLKQEAIQKDYDAKMTGFDLERTAEENRLQKLVEDKKLEQSQITDLMAEFDEIQKTKKAETLLDFQNKELENLITTENAKKEILKTQKEQDDADELLNKELKLEADLLELETDLNTKWERKKEILAEQQAIDTEQLTAQYEEGKISKENYEMALQNLELSYRQQSNEMDKERNDEYLSNTDKTLGNAQALFDESSTAYKAMAIGRATIDTYQAFTASMSDKTVPNHYLRMINAGISLASGLKTVAKIAKTKGKSIGGYTGDNSTYTPVDYLPVHGGEIVFSRADVTLMGGVNAVEAIRPTSATSLTSSTSQAIQNTATQQINYETLASVIAEATFAGTQNGAKAGVSISNLNYQIRNESKY